MNRKLKYQAAVLLLAGSLACMSGCGNKWVLEDPSTETDTMDMVTDIRDTETEEIMETEVEGETAETEDNKELFDNTCFVPDGIELKPPYIGVSMKIKDKNDWYDFIADAKGYI